MNELEGLRKALEDGFRKSISNFLDQYERPKPRMRPTKKVIDRVLRKPKTKTVQDVSKWPAFSSAATPKRAVRKRATKPATKKTTKRTNARKKTRRDQGKRAKRR